MNGEVVSDQLNNWSDDREPERILFTKETPPARFPTLTVRSRTSWLSHRALQTLRKTGLPLCKWTRTWTEVLPIDQSIGISTRDALCSAKLPGTSRALPGRLLEGSRNSEGDDEHQPGALEAARAFLEREYSVYARHVRCGGHRLGRSRGSTGKHARGRVAGRERRGPEAGGVP